MSLEPKAGHVVVRMYNVGFGDCFLLVFPEGPLRVLIDCGSHISGPGPRPIREVVGSIVEDVSDGDRARIDVLVCTHRHRDHIIGFDDPRWKDVEVGEVWMPWTEDPRDAEAKRIRERQAKLALSLVASLDGGGLAVGAGQADPVAALTLNSLTNDDAMRTLHEGFAGNPPRRFFPAGEEAIDEIPCELLDAAGVRARVLGPSRDEAVIRDVDPPSGASYLGAAAAAGGDGNSGSPFAERWQLSAEELEGDGELRDLLLGEAELATIRAAVEGDAFGAAVALEKAINGTSLVLCFDCGDARLLFPADAQWGTWKRILEDDEASDTVARTNLLKVGHHGSHNASPKGLVELLASRGEDRDDLWALVPTRPIKIWPKIPKSDLLEALAELTPRIARSDQGGEPAAPGFARWDEEAIDVHIPIR